MLQMNKRVCGKGGFIVRELNADCLENKAANFDIVYHSRNVFLYVPGM